MDKRDLEAERSSGHHAMPFSSFRELRQVHRGERFEVFRAVKADDDRCIIIKVARSLPSAVDGGALLRREYDLLRRLNVRRVMQPTSLATIDGRPAMLIGDAGSRDLATHLGGRPLAIGA